MTTALAGVTGLVAGLLAMASPPVAAVEPVEPGGSIVQIEEFAHGAVGTGSYTAVSPRLDDSLFGIRASDGTLERIAGDSAELAVPGEVAGEEILSLSSTGNGAFAAVAVLTQDGLPHIWGTEDFDTFGVVNGLDSAAELGGGGAPAIATQVAVGNNGITVGLLLADGRVGVAAAPPPYSYRVLDLPGQVEQIDAFGGGEALLLRMANGGALIWQASGTDPAGTLITPGFPELDGSGSGPADDLVDIQAGIGSTAVGVTEAGKVYAINATGARVTGDLPATFSGEGKPVQAAVLNDGFGGDAFMVRTDADRLYAYHWLAGGGYQAEADAIDVTGKDIVALTASAGGRFHIIVADEADPVDPLAPATPAQIGGTPQVGSTLTGTEATFNDATATRTNEWLVGAEVVGTGLTLPLTAVHEGKTITFRTTATRGDGVGDNRAESVSTPVGPVAAAPDPGGPGGPPATGPGSAACTNAQGALSTAQATLSGASDKLKKAKAKLKKAKKAKKPAKTMKKLKKKVKVAKMAQKAAASTTATATATASAACK